MENVLTLIAPARGGLDDAIVASAMAALKGLGVETGETGWLSPGEACDIPFDGGPLEAVEKAARDALRDTPVDLAVQGARDRRKKLLIADMDSTIITTETLDDLAERAGMKDPTAAITERAMKGEIDFADALRKRLAMLAGMKEKTLAETAAGIELHIINGVSITKASGNHRAQPGPMFCEFGLPVDRGLGLAVVTGRIRFTSHDT